MNNVIYGGFDLMCQQYVLDLHIDRNTGLFKSANWIAKETGLHLSVVKAILKRKKRG